MTVAPTPDPRVWLVRHGETEWARLGRHTGRTDIPLTEQGRDQARALGRRLGGRPFGLVLSSPLSRAAETARLVGHGDAALDPDLMEWDYGTLEGRTTAEIRADIPGWTIWRGPWPGGETAEHVYERLCGVLDQVRPRLAGGDVVLVAHGHSLRVLTLAWLMLPIERGSILSLDAGTLSALGREHGDPSIHVWNQAPV